MEFLKFISAHGKSYGTKEEFEFRSEVFKQNLEKIVEENSMNDVTYRLVINKFADMTPQEFKRMLGKRRSLAVQAAPAVPVEENLTLPTSVDWRTQGAVNSVQDQGQCGSCWAFSAIGALEGAWKVKSGNLLKLSEQQLVDCAGGSYGNLGCNGGDMGAAFDYAKTHAVELESDYPYKAVDQNCAWSAAKGKVSTTGSVNVTPNSALALKTAIAAGPVSVAIEADTFTFQFYGGGILNSSRCGTNLDHGVVAVGYGVENGKEFYIVRNSWGASWGENGYIRIAVVDGAGICGIQMEPVYPTV